jgi:hypothetical protein
MERFQALKLMDPRLLKGPDLMQLANLSRAGLTSFFQEILDIQSDFPHKISLPSRQSRPIHSSHPGVVTAVPVRQGDRSQPLWESSSQDFQDLIHRLLKLVQAIDPAHLGYKLYAPQRLKTSVERGSILEEPIDQHLILMLDQRVAEDLFTKSA